VIDVALFGIFGVSVWAVQMIWIPFWAGGVVNGIGHFRGYRNFDTADASTNVIPFGILIGGEELHNNHHAHATSARLSNKWYELDIGWMYIFILSALGLAKVTKVAPRPHLVKGKTVLDDATLQAVLRNRYEVMASFTKVAKRICRQDGDQKLRICVELRAELAAMWERSNVSREQLLLQLQDWCCRAELSGIDALEAFSLRLRQYA
jgi:stearoyl-CoA desaturase (delta-9 desaturase)